MPSKTSPDQADGRRAVLTLILSQGYSAEERKANLRRMSDGEFSRLVDEGKLRKDLTAEDISSFVTSQNSRSGIATGSEDALVPDRSPQPPIKNGDLRVVALVKIPAELPYAAIVHLKALLMRSLEDQPVHVEFKVRRGVEQQNRRDTAKEELQNRLSHILSGQQLARNGLAAIEYELLENVAWQHQQKHQKGRYPYPSSDQRSIENREHRFWIGGAVSSQTLFLKHLRLLKVVTPFSPNACFSEVDEAKCTKLALDFCEARSPRTKSINMQALKTIAETDQVNGALAAQLIEMISGRDD